MENLYKRRKFLQSLAIGAAATTLSSPWRGSAFAATPTFVNYPFSMGVASGDPTSDGFVLWTRIAPNPLDLDAKIMDLIEVIVEIADDEKFSKIVRRETHFARPDFNHSVHAEITGLPPGRKYFYRFRIGLISSPIGQAWTAVPFGTKLDKFKFAWHSCAHYEQGLYTAYGDMAKQNPDIILSLGDYIYEVSYGVQVRRMPVEEASSLDEYRLIYSATKMDKDLQAAHAVAPWLFIWDDHEVANDYQGNIGKVMAGQDPAQFVARKRAAYQAFFENLPIRSRARFDAAGNMRMYGQSGHGNLIEFNLLDTRQYRSRAACASEGYYEAQSVPRTCADLADPKRTILGARQERFFNENLMRNTKWSILVQPTIFGTLFQKNNQNEPVVYNDSWSGFELQRQKLIDNISRRKKDSQCIVIGGDMHAFMTAEVKADYNKPESETVALEFVGGSVTSKSYNYKRFIAMMPDNPHLKFYDDRTNGYGLVEVSDNKMDVKLRHTTSTWERGVPFTNLKHYIVERGVNKLLEA